MAAASSLKEYLKRYESAAADDQKKKKKKKKPKPNPGGVLVVDEDPVWHKPIQPEEDDANDEPEERPQVDEDIEVKRMRRLEAIRASKPYHAISADGSGWVAISKTPDPDLSPPRQRRSRLDTPSPPRGQDPEAQDLSPPCDRKRRFDTPSPEPEVEDLSPPRARRGSSSSPDPSPPRRTGRGVSTDGDLSPPRRTGRGLSTDASPPRRGIRETAELKDLSPPRRNLSRSGSSQDRLPLRRSPADTDLSPPRRQATDLSPPRRGRRSVSDDLPLHPPRHSPEAADLSPPRRGRKNASGDLSPPRRPTRLHSPEATDFSPQRRGRKSDLPPPTRPSQEAVDLSPPRRGRKSTFCDLPPLPPRRHLPDAVDLSPPRRTKEPSASKEEPRTGLLSAKEIKDEIDKKKKQELDRFAAMDPTLSGRGAEPVFRDKKGKRISKEDMLKEQEDNKPKEVKLEWGKGLAQKREAEARAEELELERDKPFARTRDDPELDKMLKDRIRWGDPMAHLVKRKHSDMLEDFGDNEKMKESGFIIPQTIPGHSWIKRGLDFPPNRYGIRPGRHWDGVDRSNGYEKELFKRQNEKRATESEAYLWSVSDM